MHCYFLPQPLLSEGMWSTFGNYLPPSPVIYWTNQNEADKSKLCCGWLTILRPGWHQVAVQCSTNRITSLLIDPMQNKYGQNW